MRAGSLLGLRWGTGPNPNPAVAWYGVRASTSLTAEHNKAELEQTTGPGDPKIREIACRHDRTSISSRETGQRRRQQQYTIGSLGQQNRKMSYGFMAFNPRISTRKGWDMMGRDR